MADLLPGTEVHARGLRWEVVGSERMGNETLYRLRGLEHAVLGQELDILSPFEPVQPVQRQLRPERAAPLANWLVYHEAFLLEQALGPAAFQAAQPGRLRLEPYQLVPVLRAIRMSRVRLLLADGVGLGKTVQAGLVVTELIARRLVHRVLVVSPAGPLLQQWHLEMRERFGLRLDVIDRAKLEEIRRSTELGSNPFDHVALGLASIDFLKQDRILDQLERASYDVIIIDEAHHCVDIGSMQDREGSQRRRLAEVLASRCDALLLLTATPHDGHDRSFASLCELLDPSLTDGGGVLRGNEYKRHVVRRLKKHILVEDPNDPTMKMPMFPEREVKPVPVVADPRRHRNFINLHRSLLDLVAPELRRAFRNRTYNDVLGWLALLKRSVSSVAACAQTLAVVGDRYQEYVSDTAELQELRRQRIRTLRDYERRIERFGAISLEEEQERSLLEAEDIAQQLAAMQREVRRGSYKQAKVSDVVTHLDDLQQLATAAQDEDPKLEVAVETIREIRQTEPRANILVYTEYIDSQNALAVKLHEAKLGPVVTMHGEQDEKTRIAITDRFRRQENLIFVSTDSSAEGLNLHQRCHHLLHLELPFNPNRLEQRNGRIDRYGQKEQPQVRYLYLRGTFEERILLRLIRKYERQRARLTFVPNTLGITASIDATEQRLLKPLLEEDARLFEDQPIVFDLESDDDRNETIDEATRELLEEVDRTLAGFREAARTHTWLVDAGLNADEHSMKEAKAAHDVGEKTGVVDLARFVASAVQLDGGDTIGDMRDDVFSLRLPPSWVHGLDELPGYDADHRLVRLTTHLDVTQDEKERSVGFLGRAHPLVRRAIDRVRNISFGGMEKSGQDPRASAVHADVDKPSLLYTFLGRILSRSGRELEQVLAVLVSPPDATCFHPLAEQWRHLADPARAINTKEVWKDHYADWPAGASETAEACALAGFNPIAQTFIENKTRTLEEERQRQENWLRERVNVLTSPRLGVRPVQHDFFEAHSSSDEPGPQWETIEDPVARLAAFGADREQTPAARAEAETVLRLHKRRMADLEALADIREPEIRPLGVLMLLPESGHGA